MSRTIAVFVVLFTVTISPANPTIFWASDPVGLDDTVMVSGDGFAQTASIQLLHLQRPAAERAARSPSQLKNFADKAVSVEPLGDVTDRSLKFVIPADWKPGPCAFRIITPQAKSPPQLLNFPTVYWVQGDRGFRASPDGWLRIFGRCLQLQGKKPSVVLRHDDHASRKLKIDPDLANRWSVAARIPKDIAAGNWRVMIHNGMAPCPSGRQVPTIAIEDHKPWPQDVFNVADFGASGTARAGDAVAVRTALQRAKQNGGGVVYFPRGMYFITGTIQIPPKTVLKGEGTRLVSLFWPDTDDPYTLIRGTHHFGVQDLTIYASNYRHCIAGDVGKDNSGHTFLDGVRLRADIYMGHLKPDEVNDRFKQHLQLSTGGGDTVRLGGENVRITNCDLYGSGRSLYLLRVRGGYVSGNTFYNGRWGWYCLDGSDRLIFEDNELIGGDLMSTGGGVNCLSSSYSQHVYYAHNSISKTHGWDREAMTSDGSGGAYYGKVQQADGKRLVLAEDADWGRGRDWIGSGVFILGGKGMGQYRRVADHDGRTVTLDRPWKVPPDDTSIITITMLQRRYLFIGNSFADVGIGLQYYGTSIEHVACGNECARGGGFYNSGRWYHHFEPSWYCQFLENEILEGNSYRFGANNATRAGLSYIGTYGVQSHGGTEPLAFCSIHRRNHLHNNAQLRFRGYDSENPGLRDLIAEHNIIENTPQAIFIGDGCRGVTIRENQFHNCDSKVVTRETIRQRLKQRREKLRAEDGPVAYYNFDSPMNLSVADASGHDFPAHATGPIEFESGVSGKAAHFHGDSYFIVNDDRMLQFPKITVSAWVRPDHEKGRWGVVAKRNSNRSAPYVVAIRGGKLTFEGTDIHGDWSYNLYGDGAVHPNLWNHVAAVCIEGRKVRLYCNGEPAGTKKVDAPLVETPDVLTIGYEAWGGIETDPKKSGKFQGTIDDVKIWSRTLSDGEIAAEYKKLADKAKADDRRRKKQAKKRQKRLARFKQRIVDPAGQNWKILEADNFERKTIGDRWKTLRGEWTIKNGTIHCNDTSYLGCTGRVGPPARIEFDARSDNPGDLTAFWGTADDAYKSGYFIGFASNGNTANKILRLGQTVAQNSEPNAVAGKWHHVIAQIRDGKVRLIVDDQPALQYTDPEPLTEPYMPGIIAWSSGEFDNVRIYGAP